MNRDLKIKNKDVKLQEFFTNYILLVTYLDKRYAEILGLLMSKYPSITIDEEMKKAISEILGLRHKKTEYQNPLYYYEPSPYDCPCDCEEDDQV